MSRDGHDSACAIATQNIISDPNRNLSARGWINRIATSKDTSLFFIFLTFDLAFLDGICAIFLERIFRVGSRKILNERMLWSKHQESGAKERIWTSCKDANLSITIFNAKVELSTFTAADPVFLHGFDFFWPVE